MPHRPHTVPRRAAAATARTHRAATALAAVTLLLPLTACRRPVELPRPQRIILISMDTVRADHVTPQTAPELARLAADGFAFRRFYAASSYTIPAHMSIFTGRDPLEHGMVFDFARLSPEVPLLAELLHAAAWHTEAAHEGGYVDGRFGFDRGFEHYTEMPRISVVDENLESILDWVRAAPDEPYFLFLHTYAAHFPYGGIDRYRREHPERGLPSPVRAEQLRALVRAGGPEAVPEELRDDCQIYNHFVRRYAEMIKVGPNRTPLGFEFSEFYALDNAEIRASYDERIHLIDTAIGRLRRTLEELGQWNETLLVVVGDHGEAFHEHGLEQHGYVPFDEVLHVPLVIHYPPLTAAAGTAAPHAIDDLAWQLDILPTILHLAGVTPPSGLEGIDLTAAMLGDGLPDRTVYPAVLQVAHEEQKPLRRVAIHGHDKWIEGNQLFGDADGLLFDLAADPGERHNLRATHTRDAHRLAKAAIDRSEQLVRIPPLHQATGEPITGDGSDQPEIALTNSQREQLRALGYLN